MSRFKKAFLHYFRKNERARALAAVIGIAVGDLILLIATLVAGNEDMIPIGSFTGAFACAIMSILITLTCFTDDYPELIRLGVTRRCALLCASAETLFVPMLYVLGIALIELIERGLFRLLLGLEGGRPIFGQLLPIMLGAVAAVWMMGLLAAWCIRRFGQNGMIAIYCVYIVLFVFLPQMLGAMVERFAIIEALVTFIISNAAAAIILAILAVIAAALLLLRGLYRLTI